jgi:spore maturation protein CgeB
MRVLFVGENWFGSGARACSYGLRRLGCDVHEVDLQTIFPQWHMRTSRAIRRVLVPRLVREYNQQILQAAYHFQPDFLLAFKGIFILSKTLCELHRQNIALYNYYPDRIFLTRSADFAYAVSEYDCFFDTKKYWDGDAAQRYQTRERVFLPHGYDPEIHHHLELQERDRHQFTCDVSVIATHMPVKEEIISQLLKLRPNVNLNIWGNQWSEYCRSPDVRRLVRGPALHGLSYTKAVVASRINLVLLGIVPASRDETTMRSYEIPACGGFMLHPRTPELDELYEEGREVACFESIEELAEKIDYYLANSEDRHDIAHAGHLRCVPAYSYDRRMAEIVRWHRERKGVPAPINRAVAAIAS